MFNRAGLATKKDENFSFYTRQESWWIHQIDHINIFLVFADADKWNEFTLLDSPKTSTFTLDLHTWWIYDDLLTKIDYIAGACTHKKKNLSKTLCLPLSNKNIDLSESALSVGQNTFSFLTGLSMLEKNYIIKDKSKNHHH